MACREKLQKTCLSLCGYLPSIVRLAGSAIGSRRVVVLVVGLPSFPFLSFEGIAGPRNLLDAHVGRATFAGVFFYFLLGENVKITCLREKWVASLPSITSSASFP
jgi:hypothetical protein